MNSSHQTAPELTAQSDSAQHLQAIAESAADLAGRFDLQPLLERILRHVTRLLGCESGSVCLVDEDAHTYTKRVDFGVGCQEGQTFSLDQGVTGEVVRRRDTVILHSYSLIEAGHIAADDPLSRCAVIGVPIRWADAIIGSCVIFSAEPGRLFTTTEAQLAELFASHAAIAIANAELHAKAAERERESAVSQERERAVQDLHNTVGRSLSTVLDYLDDAGQHLETKHPARQRIEAASLQAQEALAEARRTALGIGPASLEGRTLEEALRRELDWVGSVASLDTDLTVAGTPRLTSAEVEHQLFRIAQEALSNVVAHARADRVRVGLMYGTRSTSLIVEDNGRGFNVPETRTLEGSLARGCLGLHGMSSRALHLGGDVRIESIEGWGTVVRCVLPDAPTSDDVPPPTAWKVLISSGQSLVTAGIVRLLNLHEPSMQIVADASPAEELLDSMSHLTPDVVVLDLDSYHRDLVEIDERLRQVNPDAAMVVYMDTPTVDTIRLARQLGVRGYLNRRSSPESIVRSIVAAGQGEALIDGDLYEKLIDASSADSGGERLTAREREVRALVAKGLADKQIATALGISVKTVEKHVGSLLRKTGSSNRTMLAGIADDRSLL